MKLNLDTTIEGEQSEETLRFISSLRGSAQDLEDLIVRVEEEGFKIEINRENSEVVLKIQDK